MNIPFHPATFKFREDNYVKVDIVLRALKFLSCRVTVLVRWFDCGVDGSYEST